MHNYSFHKSMPLKKLILIVVLCLSSAHAQKNALWIWNTTAIIEDHAWRDSISFVAERLDIRTLFLYAPHKFSKEGDTCSLRNKSGLIELLQWTKKNEFSVHLVAGEPEWALPQYHHKAISFAHSAMALQRETGLIDGIQYDIEPYLLLPFSLKKTREGLLKNWIHLIWLTGKIVREQPHVSFGAAVPFWLDESLTIEGLTLPAVRHIIHLTDYVAVMAYRDKAAGNASIISFSEDERQWAEESRRTVYLGVETGFLGGGPSYYLCETDPDSFALKIDISCGKYNSYYIGKRKLSVQTIEGKVIIGVSAQYINDDEVLLIQKELMECFSAGPLELDMRSIDQFVKKSGEWKNPEFITLSGSKRILKMDRKELKQSTMWYLTPPLFQNEMQLLNEYASVRKAVSGVAVHDLKSVLRLLNKN